MQFVTCRVSLLNRLKLLFVLVFLVVSVPSTIQAQASSVRISVLSLEPARVRVELNILGSTEWSFRNTYGSVVGLANRLENFHGKDAGGRQLMARKLAPGEFRFSETVTSVSYEVLLSPPTRLADLSHISWLNKEHGLLMLGDLLPAAGMAEPLLNLKLVLPPGWSSTSNRNSDGEQHVVSRPEQTVFLVGSSLRKKSAKVGTAEIRIVTVGDWSFSESEIRKIVVKIVEEYTRVLRQPPPDDVALLLVPFSDAVGPERWTAETRGKNVVLLMGRRAKSGALLARLKVVLAHELFHLWIPNSLTLQGDYDWFFEGFTLYQALLTSLRLNYITFEDYLETLSRVYSSYRSSTERDKLSLLDASERRWTAASSLVYDKGALVAFIYDLMLRQSARRETLSDIYPEVLQAGRGNRQDANELLIKLLNQREGMERFSEQFVQSTAEIDLASVLAPFGLEIAGRGSSSRIQVSSNINKDQRQLLKALGYKK
jgi:Peptidase family M1 domain